ncbi:hypothetical protein E2C01_008592 [Portunus trituberculatus]|uniref:Uncharacterized protein n=1 Tax=Portunus trituberculatus TaxID=210409 RepID=A0A5B7D2D8_PORTR|nr:hypothetical protein [Portunus trituberculatus]
MRRNPGGGAYVLTASRNTVLTRLGTRAALSSSCLPHPYPNPHPPALRSGPDYPQPSPSLLPHTSRSWLFTANSSSRV